MRRLEFVVGFVLFIGSVWRFALWPGYLFLAEQFEALDARLFLRVTELWPNTEIFSEADVGKLYLYWLLYAASGGNYKLLQILALGLPVALAYLSASLLLGRFSRWGWILALLYVFNPLFVNQPRDVQFRFEYALFPLALHLLLGALEGRRAHALGLALVLGMASYRFYAVFAVAALIVTLWRLPRGVSWRWLFLSAATGAVLALPRVLPGVIHVLEGGSLALATLGVTETIRRVDVFSALVLNFYYPGDVFEKITYGVLNYGFLPVVFLVAAVAIRRRGGVVLLGLSMVAAGVLLTSTINVDYLLSMSDVLARLYRQPYWNGILTLIGYLLVLSHARDLRVVAAALAVPLAFYAPVVFSGYMWGYWCAAEPPGAYWHLPHFEGKALWIPGMGDFRAQWVRCRGPWWTSERVWGPTGIVEIRSWGGPALSLTYTSLLSQYFAFFNYLNYSGFPFAIASVDPKLAYGIVGISYVGVVYDRITGGELRAALREVGGFFAGVGVAVLNSSEVTVVKLGEAPLCRVGGFVTLTGGYPALGALFSALGWRAPPVVFDLFNSSAVQGDDVINGYPVAVVKLTSFKYQGLRRGTGIIYDSFYRELSERGGIWSFDDVTEFLYGDSGVAYGVVKLPSGAYDVYIRGYVSNISGVLTLRVGFAEYNISLRADVARFRWVKVGRLEWGGGDVEIEARFSGGLVAVGELAFVRPVPRRPKPIYIYTPYDLPGPKYRDPRSPLGYTVGVSGLFKVPGEGEYVVYIAMSQGVVLGPGGVLIGNGTVVKGGDFLDFVKARLSYIIFIRKDWLEKLSIRNASCHGTFRVADGEFVQFNVLYDSSWELRCNSGVYKPVPVYGLVAGYYVDRGGMCQLYYSLYDVQKISFLTTAAYIFILLVCLVLWRRGLCRLLYLRKTPPRPSQ